MKKGMLVLLPIMVLFSVSAWAQDEFPKFEAFGGFSVFSWGENGEGRFNPLGFQAGVAGNFHKNFGIAGDFGAQFKEGMHFYEFMGGPRYTARMDKVNAFVHALFGGVTIGESSSSTSFAMGIGGGIDINARDHFAVRVIQFDWIPINHESQWYKNQIRFGFGIVYK